MFKSSINIQPFVIVSLFALIPLFSFAQDTKPSKGETVRYLEGKTGKLHGEKYPNSTNDIFFDPNFYLSNDEILTISFGVSNWKSFNFLNYWEGVCCREGITENTYAEYYKYSFQPIEFIQPNFVRFLGG